MEITRKWPPREQHRVWKEKWSRPNSLEGLPKQRDFLSPVLSAPQIVLSGIHPFSGPLGYAKLLIQQERQMTKPHAARVQPES